jgi:predicted transcriptional regulator
MKTFPCESASPVRPRSLDEVPERVRQIAMLRGLGYSYRQIAGPLHVTPQAVSLMLARHRRSLQSLRDAMELNSLSARAVNALGRHGIRTREQACQADVLQLLAGERNCGRKTMDEIARWMEEDGGNLINSRSQSSAGPDPQPL